MLLDDICFYCGDATDLVDDDDIARLRDQFGIVHPICSVCKLTKPVKTRNVIKSIKQK
ncbi:hypothetical protein DPMN_097934 [Dreissena polymorpha]|uniref:Uncharacterized protein n=1 Tax=Dreissena polymorpha TaxID=45954 RepID=A0A9D4LB51_DREPO|nr:hypothetical protein DPMN_097934 [Dreissena polymorpha]